MSAQQKAISPPSLEADGLFDSAKCNANLTPSHSKIKVKAKLLIVHFAVLGYLSVPTTEWLIRRGGLKHE